MESLNSLYERKKQLESELANITIKQHNSSKWAPGVHDQFKSESYSYEEYTDYNKAYKLKDQIAYLDNLINTYVQRAQEEQEREKAIRESLNPRYEYTSAGKNQTTKNPAIAARYNAQQRLFGMNKLQQAIMTISGQKRKFKQLWLKANTKNAETQEQVAVELNKMFR